MKYLFSLLVVFSLFACGETKPQGTAESAGSTAAPAQRVANTTPIDPPRIEVQVNGLTGGEARLIGMYTDQNYLAARATVDAQGHFVFENSEGYKPGFFFIVLPDNTNFQIMMDRDQQFKITTNLGNLAGDLQVEGNLETQLFYENMRYEAVENPKFVDVNQKLQSVQQGSAQYQQYKEQQDALVAQRKAYIADLQQKYPNSLFVSFKTAGQNPDLKDIRNPDGSMDSQAQVAVYRREFWDNVDFSDVRLLSTPVISNKLKRYMSELTAQQPDSIRKAASHLVDKVLDYPEYFQYFANWIMLQYEPDKTTLMDPQAVFVHMAQNYFTYDRAFWSDSTEIYAIQLRAHEMAQSLVGQKGPDVRAMDPNGNMRAISDIKSPYVIVYMFDPNCDQCAIETPKLVQWYRQWKSKGVEVYAIALNTNDQEWKNYIAKNGLGNWINVHDPTNKAIYATYFVDHTPEIYVLDPQRTIIAKNLKVDQIATVLERDMTN
ncbi:thioredoxin-like domain-containing protein [Flavilitoribacter nigricans]|uniref:thioredoxin-like domain-containing protein n=1 Tax=Flavilitoribacter nigricans TaxID=70997 RepID=UPI001F310C01|nr:thioredoxin-like domain-containing protein [Flavilitoribacter nigricans]